MYVLEFVMFVNIVTIFALIYFVIIIYKSPIDILYVPCLYPLHEDKVICKLLYIG